MTNPAFRRDPHSSDWSRSNGPHTPPSHSRGETSVIKPGKDQNPPCDDISPVEGSGSRSDVGSLGICSSGFPRDPKRKRRGITTVTKQGGWGDTTDEREDAIESWRIVRTLDSTGKMSTPFPSSVFSPLNGSDHLDP